MTHYQTRGQAIDVRNLNPGDTVLEEASQRLGYKRFDGSIEYFISESKVLDLIKKQLELTFANSPSCPPGTIVFWPSPIPPNGWIKANGAELDRAVYSDLFAAIGTRYGAGNGTTFNIPDLRGLAIRCLDEGRGFDLGRLLGTYQADAYKAFQFWINALNYAPGRGSHNWGIYGGGNLSMALNILLNFPGGSEITVKNFSLLGIIKY